MATGAEPTEAVAESSDAEAIVSLVAALLGDARTSSLQSMTEPEMVGVLGRYVGNAVRDGDSDALTLGLQRLFKRRVVVGQRQR